MPAPASITQSTATVAVASQFDADRRLAVALGILEEVADHAPQELRVAGERDRLTIERAVVVVGAFLRDQREEVEALFRRRRGDDVEAARQQDFLDEIVELGDVALQLGLRLGRRVLAVELDAQAQARQRRAQLVGGVGEQEPVGADELLDPRRRAVEARRRAARPRRARRSKPGSRDCRRRASRRPPAAARSAWSARAPPDRQRSRSPAP